MLPQVNSSFWVYIDGMPEYDSDYDFYDEHPEWQSGFFESNWLLDEFDQTEPATVDGAPLPSFAYSRVQAHSRAPSIHSDERSVCHRLWVQALGRKYAGLTRPGGQCTPHPPSGLLSAFCCCR